MGDNTDGSSSAAQGAHEEEDVEQGHGPLEFLNRWLGLGHETDEPEEEEKQRGRPSEEADAREMLLNIRNMRTVRVQDIAVPRADIAAVPDDASLKDLVEVFRETHNTRLPVYAETMDNPVGFVHLKDIALRYGFNGHANDFDIKALIRPLLYVPPSMPMGVLLAKMQTERIHMALVIDEYGGVDGLLTIEDLVEQIVGEIADEHETDEAAQWVEEAPGVYLVSARAGLEEFEDTAGVDLLSDELDEDVDTLGGLIFMLAGRVPLRGEVIPHPQGHEFEVVDADPRMVKRIRVRLRPALDRAAE